METIEIFGKHGMYYTKFSDPKVISLFGTDTIVTPYTSAWPADQVLKEITKRNPDCIVTIKTNR